MLENIYFKIFLVAVVSAGFFLVLSGGVTTEEWHTYAAFAAAVLLIGGILKAKDVVDYVKSKLPTKPDA